jgi:hypothetical protein
VDGRAPRPGVCEEEVCHKPYQTELQRLKVIIFSRFELYESIESINIIHNLCLFYIKNSNHD